MIIRNTLYLFVVFLAFFCPHHSFAQELKQGFMRVESLGMKGILSEENRMEWLFIIMKMGQSKRR